MNYNLNELALTLLNAHKSHQTFRVAVPSEILIQAIRIASKYEKNNPVLYVLDFTKAKIVKTTQAEYDLSLSTQSRFSKPFTNRKDIFDHFFTILKNNIKIILKNDPNIKYVVH